MNLQCIAEHTVDLDLLTGGIVIDAGCFGFEFSKGMRDLGCKVLAFDIQDLTPPPHCVSFLRRAVHTKEEVVNYMDMQDKQATRVHIHGNNEVHSVDIYSFMNNCENWIDVLKLDIEAWEYVVLNDVRLMSDEQNLPRQISVEFHEHADKNAHDWMFNNCIENLSHNYIPVQHERTSQHGAGFNYWDSLFIRKDLI